MPVNKSALLLTLCRQYQLLQTPRMWKKLSWTVLRNWTLNWVNCLHIQTSNKWVVSFATEILKRAVEKQLAAAAHVQFYCKSYVGIGNIYLRYTSLCDLNFITKIREIQVIGLEFVKTVIDVNIKIPQILVLTSSHVHLHMLGRQSRLYECDSFC